MVKAIEGLKDKPHHEKIRNFMYANIVLTGGSALFEGLEDRVAEEVKALAPPNQEVNVLKNNREHRLYGTWIGGSILTSLDDFASMVVTRQAYEDKVCQYAHGILWFDNCHSLPIRDVCIYN